MLNRKGVVLAMLALAPTSALSQERIEFKGVPLGSTRAEFVQKNPMFNCRATSKSCSLNGLDASQHCKLRMYESGARDSNFPMDECLSSVKTSATYGNQPAYLFATFREDVLSGGSALIEPSSFDSIADAIVVRYGQPVTAKNETVQNRAGAKFENRQMEWSVGGDGIFATKYGSTVTRGIIDIRDRQSIIEMKSKVEKTRKSAPADL